MKREQELETFKREVSIGEYAAAQGYELDARESSAASQVMRRGAEKIVVATDQDRHGIYFDVHNPENSGTVIDFAQAETGGNIGQVRKQLRPYVGQDSGPLPEAEQIKRPEPSTKDRAQQVAKYAQMQQPERSAYLEARGVDGKTQQDPRFAGTFRQDQRGNTVFPHYDEAGLSGYELKNQGFTGFSAGGEKALWHSTNIERAERVVVVESVIDAMSHAQVTGETGAAYISIGGQMSEHQRDQLRNKLEQAHARGAQIEIATDNDDAGKRLGQQIRADSPAGAQLQQRTPSVGVDWNEQAQARQRAEAERKVEQERQREGPQMGG
jgi:predicted heme/steroid binding protein